ncbi:MAG: redoxin domain-containing protein [Candidatus Heimdallarchaeota archaeon]|nr:redoxin domain-containing protein [Candidatus Heimdallarchaeota archaeon]
MSKKKPNGKLEVGDEAPLFTLKNEQDEEVALENFLGKKVIILYFYPKDGSKGCTAQACSFRDRYELFKEAGAEVIGISSDSSSSHQSFSNKYKLPFLLLSDPEDKVRELYGVKATLGIIPGRVTYIVDKQGIIRHIFSSQFNPKKHVDEALSILEKIKNE